MRRYLDPIISLSDYYGGHKHAKTLSALTMTFSILHYNSGKSQNNSGKNNS